MTKYIVQERFTTEDGALAAKLAEALPPGTGDLWVVRGEADANGTDAAIRKVLGPTAQEGHQYVAVATPTHWRPVVARNQLQLLPVDGAATLDPGAPQQAEEASA